MQELADKLIEYLKFIAEYNNPVFSAFIAFLIIVVESIVPILPLAAFVVLNMIIFGNTAGFILSWIATITGCVLSFLIFRKGFSKYFYRSLSEHNISRKLVAKIDKMSFRTLLLITAMPFSPAFTINIGAGLSKMRFKKFLAVIALSKLSIVYFWGFVGTTLLTSLEHPGKLIGLTGVIILAYLISTYYKNKYNIE